MLPILLLLGMFILLLIGSALGRQLMARVRKLDETEWNRLGRGTAWYSSPYSAVAYLGFVLLGQYRRYGDAEVDELGDKLRVLEIGYLALFLAFMTCLIWPGWH